MFTDQDKETCAKLGALIRDKATFNLTAQEAITLAKCCVWFNELPAKIDQCVMELKAVHQSQPEEAS